MSQIVYRGNLSSKSFPLLTDFQGQTVIVGGPDNSYSRSLTSSEDQDKDVGLPYLYYCHNVLPAPYGINSVGYDQVIPPVFPASTAFTDCKILKSNPISITEDGPVYYFAPVPSGKHLIYLLGGTAWVPIANTVAYPAGTQITYAIMQGIHYICFSKIGTYKYDSTTNTLVQVTLTSLVDSIIIGICACQGYLLAHTEYILFWSSVLDVDYTTNAIDFTPSLLTNASNIRVEGTKGKISFILPASFGVSIYTDSNTVSGIYSSNPRYPFNFREVIASGGCTDIDHVAYDANTSGQYAYTTAGFQLVKNATTDTLYPEITDFLGGKDFEDFDEATLTFSTTNLTAPMVKKIAAVSSRYLVISYGISSLTHAIVYDMVQKRYGKLKIDHVDCFEYEYLDPVISDAPRNSIAFLKSSGEIVVLNPAVTLATSKGVVLLGKFQYVRSRLLTLEGLTIQTVHQDQSVVAYNLFSDSGGPVESCTRSIGYENSVSGDAQRSYEFHDTGKNHSILITGGFFLSSFVLTFHIDGTR